VLLRNSKTITEFRTAQVLEEVDFVKDKSTLARVKVKLNETKV